MSSKTEPINATAAINERPPDHLPLSDQELEKLRLFALEQENVMLKVANLKARYESIALAKENWAQEVLRDKGVLPEEYRFDSEHRQFVRVPNIASARQASPEQESASQETGG